MIPGNGSGKVNLVPPWFMSTRVFGEPRLKVMNISTRLVGRGVLVGKWVKPGSLGFSSFFFR